jgi:hypothetical protein
MKAEFMNPMVTGNVRKAIFRHHKVLNRKGRAAIRLAGSLIFLL